MYFDSDWFIVGDVYYSITESLRGDRGVDQKLERMFHSIPILHVFEEYLCFGITV